MVRNSVPKEELMRDSTLTEQSSEKGGGMRPFTTIFACLGICIALLAIAWFAILGPYIVRVEKHVMDRIDQASDSSQAAIKAVSTSLTESWKMFDSTAVKKSVRMLTSKELSHDTALVSLQMQNNTFTQSVQQAETTLAKLERAVTDSSKAVRDYFLGYLDMMSRSLENRFDNLFQLVYNVGKDQETMKADIHGLAKYSSSSLHHFWPFSLAQGSYKPKSSKQDTTKFRTLPSPQPLQTAPSD